MENTFKRRKSFSELAVHSTVCVPVLHVHVHISYLRQLISLKKRAVFRCRCRVICRCRASVSCQCTQLCVLHVYARAVHVHIHVVHVHVHVYVSHLRQLIFSERAVLRCSCFALLCLYGIYFVTGSLTYARSL